MHYSYLVLIISLLITPNCLCVLQRSFRSLRNTPARTLIVRQMSTIAKDIDGMQLSFFLFFESHRLTIVQHIIDTAIKKHFEQWALLSCCE